MSRTHLTCILQGRTMLNTLMAVGHYDCHVSVWWQQTRDARAGQLVGV